MRAWDPIVPADDYAQDWEIRPCEDAREAATGADALVFVTPKDEFRNLDLAALGDRMARRVLVDPMGVFDVESARRAGFAYVAIGRGFTGAFGDQRPAG